MLKGIDCFKGALTPKTVLQYLDLDSQCHIWKH